MKKLVLSLFVTFTFIVYALSQRQTEAVVPIATTTQSSSTSTSQASSSQAPIESIPSSSSSSPSSSSSLNQSGLADGTYTGQAANAFYGYVQVEATIQSGKITDVQFLQYPTGRSTSMMINRQAMPILRSEAIQAQSANVNIVSGATDTSEAFIQSLQSALSQAGQNV